MTALEKQNMVKNSLQRLCKHTYCEDCEFLYSEDATGDEYWCGIRDKDGQIPYYKTWDMESAIGEVAEEHNNGWISCGEQMPEIYDDTNTSDVVLVCCSNSCQYMAFWCDDLQWRFCECGTAKEPIHWTDIIAWQSLPKPYNKQN